MMAFFCAARCLSIRVAVHLGDIYMCVCVCVERGQGSTFGVYGLSVTTESETKTRENKKQTNASFHLHKMGTRGLLLIHKFCIWGIITTTPLLSLASKDRFTLDTLHVQPDILIQLQLQSL